MSQKEQPTPGPQQGVGPHTSELPQGTARPVWAEASPPTQLDSAVETVPAVDTVEPASEPAVTVVDGAPATEPRPLGRTADEVAVAPMPVPRAAPQVSPQERLRRQNWMGLGGRMVGGLVTLALLLAALSSGWSWSSVLFAWVLLTIVADEFGGWFGYIAAFMGVLTLLLGNQPAEVWNVVLPLVGGALLALLVVKHSGGWGVLPFAGAVFALPIIGAAQFGHLLDENLLLVADPDLARSAILAMLVGLGISLVRQFIMWLVDLTSRRAERRLLRADQVPLR
ncbi:hypothetical protein GCM10017783_20540 [Deinococcus piscis]|uniref:FUSC family protein n=1 Tax=Deinococcus piscis TaxID=394230 RepID=A0ABQ3K8D0_9DEIO|nr:hypothetical protein [Deinococcus piscis]GHG07837.1 hypothetical protein GCM10017783_20540 [Deinococcus piscis]